MILLGVGIVVIGSCDRAVPYSVLYVRLTMC